MNKLKMKKPSKGHVIYTPDYLVKERDEWVDAFATSIERVKEDYPGQPIYEYQLVAIHHPPPVVPQYTRKELK